MSENTDDTKALVERLHDVLRNWTNVTDDEQAVIRQAADTIERLERELAEAPRDARQCRASVDVAHTLPVPDDALPFTCCCCRQTHYMAPVSAKATPLRRPMSQGGGVVYDPGCLTAPKEGA